MAHVYVRSGAAGAATGADWANAYLTLAAALTAKAAGDQFWVSEDHAESTAGAITLTSPGTAAAPCTIRVVNHAGTVPPVSADLTSGAVIATTGANSITCLAHADCDGIEWKIASAASAGNFNILTTAVAGFWKFGSLTKITFVGTGASKVIIGHTSTAIVSGTDWRSVTLKFAAVGQFIQIQNTRFEWRGGSLDGAGSIPTALLAPTNGGSTFLEFVDLSAMGSGKTIVPAGSGPHDVYIKDCKLGASVTRAAAATGPGGTRTRFARTSSSGIVYEDSQHNYLGSELAVANVIRTGGSVYSHKFDTLANTKFFLPYRGLPFGIYNRYTLTDQTLTVYGIANMAAMPLNDEFWVNVVYPGATTSPLGTQKTSAKADILATGVALTADTSAWDIGATARADSTAYVVGDVRKASSNAGRLFFCTTAGTTAASIPAGYGTAVDGGSVTDGTAVFRAGWRFKIVIALTSPQQGLAGRIDVWPTMGVASAQIYLGRKLELS